MDFTQKNNDLLISSWFCLIVERRGSSDSQKLFSILFSIVFLITAISTTAFAQSDAEKVIAQNDRVASLINRGQFFAAAKLATMAVTTARMQFGDTHVEYGRSLNHLGVIYLKQGKHTDSMRLLKKALSITKRAFGEKDRNVATISSNLAIVCRLQGNYEEAIKYSRTAVNIHKKTLGKNHPDYARSLTGLGVLLLKTGQYSDSEIALKDAIRIFKNTTGKNDIRYAHAINNLADLYSATSRDSSAEPLMRSSLEIRRALYGENHPEVSQALYNLGICLFKLGKFTRAESILIRSLKIAEHTLDEDHPDIATAATGLAKIFQMTGRLGAAESLHRRALKIREKAFGKESVLLAKNLGPLALIYEKTDRFKDAEKYYLTALRLNQIAFGNYNVNVSTNKHNLALFYARMGDYLKCHQYLLESIAIKEKIRDEAFLVLDEKQKINYLDDSNFNIAMLVNNAFQHKLEPALQDEAFNIWLRWKGSALEAQSQFYDLIYNTGDLATRRKAQTLINIKRKIGELFWSNTVTIASSNYKHSMKLLENKKREIEQELVRVNSNYKMLLSSDRFNSKKLINLLPPDSVYIDFYKLRTYEFRMKHIFDHRSSRWGKWKYFAFVLTKSNNIPSVHIVDIGKASSIDNEILNYRKEINSAKEYEELPRPDVLTKSATALYQLVFGKLKSFVSGKTKLYISPDGNLHLIPFEIFVTPSGKYLLEDFDEISYITTGRDIIRLSDKSVSTPEFRVFANPNYNLVRLHSKSSKHFKNKYNLWFKPLTETTIEAESIKKLVRRKTQFTVSSYQGDSASQEMLLASNRPRILHISTHGYFIQDKSLSSPLGADIRANKSGIRDVDFENSMLRSGIALAGANTSLKYGRSYGLISADKILGLNLKGTELVVLSACETGVGSIQNSEGILGLKRAFILSGAKSMIMSLWAVPVNETTIIMNDFYELYLSGYTKADALKQAKINMLKSKRNPFYWGGFVLSGNPS